MTERGTASLIHRVAMMIRTPAQRWIAGFSLSNGMNITRIATSIPINAPMEAGDRIRLEKGTPTISAPIQ